MKTTEYRTDITEAEFDPVKSCLQIRRSSKWPLIMIVNAIFYVCGEGIKWRALPKDFAVPWQTVYWYFRKWTGSGAWVAINEALVIAGVRYCMRGKKGFRCNFFERLLFGVSFWRANACRGRQAFARAVLQVGMLILMFVCRH